MLIARGTPCPQGLNAWWIAAGVAERNCCLGQGTGSRAAQVVRHLWSGLVELFDQVKPESGLSLTLVSVIKQNLGRINANDCVLGLTL